MVYIRGSAKYASLFAQMFPDSEIALWFQVQKDENPYAVIYGLGSFSKNSGVLLFRSVPFHDFVRQKPKQSFAKYPNGDCCELG